MNKTPDGTPQNPDGVSRLPVPKSPVLIFASPSSNRTTQSSQSRHDPALETVSSTLRSPNSSLVPREKLSTIEDEIRLVIAPPKDDVKTAETLQLKQYFPDQVDYIPITNSINHGPQHGVNALGDDNTEATANSLIEQQLVDSFSNTPQPERMEQNRYYINLPVKDDIETTSIKYGKKSNVSEPKVDVDATTATWSDGLPDHPPSQVNRGIFMSPNLTRIKRSTRRHSIGAVSVLARTPLGQLTRSTSHHGVFPVTRIETSNSADSKLSIDVRVAIRLPNDEPISHFPPPPLPCSALSSE